MPPMLLKWLQETLKRLFLKKPKYFTYWQMFSGALGAISGIPYLLVQLNINLPEPFATLSNKVVTWVAGTMWLMAQLTVTAPTVGQTTEGSTVKVMDDKDMPFSYKSEGNKVEETAPPPPVLEGVPEAKNANTDLEGTAAE